MNFPSTLLSQTNDPKEIQKADLDLLDKINKLGGQAGATVVNPIAQTAALFTSSNPTLQAGQLGYETDTKFFKIGDGTTAWTSLSYQSVKNSPLPQTAAGVGQVSALTPGVNVALVAPAGGTWYVAYWGYTAAGLVGAVEAVAIVAGGATVAAANPAIGWITTQLQRIA
jgi:hypothetical protein